MWTFFSALPKIRRSGGLPTSAPGARRDWWTGAKCHPPRRSLIVGLACALLLGGYTSPSLAQGTIYYQYYNYTTYDLRAVNVNGSNDRLVFKDISISPRDQWSYGPTPSCSHASHNGALTWLVVLNDDPFYTGDPTLSFNCGTLYQVTTGANGGTSLVQLSNFDANHRGVGLFCDTGGGAVWAADDSFISFVLVDATGATPVLKIARFPVANLVTNGGVLIDETNVATVMVSPNLNNDAYTLEHSWSPDGTLLAYRNLYYKPNVPDKEYTQLILRDVASGAERVLVDEGVSGIRVDRLEYAPDGTRLAFEANGQRDVATISVQGGAPKVVAAASTSKSGYGTRYADPTWSPDSNGLAIEMLQDYKWGTYYYVAKVPSTGGTATNLTPRNANPKGPRAWR
jgi:hypothetical protein